MQTTQSAAPTTRAVQAVYDPDTMAETGNNRLLAAIPEIPDVTELFERLKRRPTYTAEDRKLPLSRKLRRLRRLKELFVPTGRLLQLALEFDATLRAAYAMRNPDGQGAAEIRRSLYEAAQSGEAVFQDPDPTERHADAITLLGHSGNGKSAGIGAVLRLYPQVVRHDDVVPWDQIVWLKLEMAVDGSLKQLLGEFFSAVDDLLKTNYFDQYGDESVPLPKRLLAAEQILARHHVGFLIIEEVQYVTIAGADGMKKFSNFVTRLLNRVRCPVMFIGTNGATTVLSRNMRQARRCGSTFFWEPYPNGGDWKKLVDALWECTYVELDWPEDVDRYALLHRFTRGLPGILVPLFIATQMKAAFDAKPLSPAYLEWTLEHRFRLVKPILDAMGLPEPERTRVLSKLDDVLPDLLEQAVDAAAANIVAMDAKGRHEAELAALREQRRTRLIALAQELRYGRVAVTQAVDRLIDDERYLDDGSLLVAVVRQLESRPKSKKVKAQPTEEMPPEDLRRVA